MCKEKNVFPQKGDTKWASLSNKSYKSYYVWNRGRWIHFEQKSLEAIVSVDRFDPFLHSKSRNGYGLCGARRGSADRIGKRKCQKNGPLPRRSRGVSSFLQPCRAFLLYLFLFPFQ